MMQIILDSFNLNGQSYHRNETPFRSEVRLSNMHGQFE